MTIHTLSFLLALSGMTTVIAQSTPPATPATPLASKTFAYPNGIPYQADTDNLLRGRQFGYNLCNSTTEGPNSLCQTSFLNNLDDFCLWAPSKPNSLIADTEGEEVAWCTKPGHGTRLIPKGALQGVQFMRTPDYVQVVGFINQPLINLQEGDSGGELDPHGADLRGNPLGGLVYSNAFPTNNGNNNTFQQVFEWHNFMGGSQFCFKACDAARPHAAQYCQHIYDRIGCAYNAPNAAQKGVFESCQGESQDFPGVYVVNGVTSTYTQPPESLGAITSMPYTARIPASSNCVTFKSADLFAALPTASVTPTPTATATKQAATPNGASSRTIDGAAATQTVNGAGTLAISSVTGFAGLLGIVLSALMV